MNLFKKIFNKKPKKKEEMLESIPSWEISPPSDPAEIFKYLKIITPENSNMYFEDVYDKEVKEMLKIISVDSTILEGGTLWPKPDAYHIPATEENYKKIQEIAKNHPLSVHFHTHRNNDKIIEWYDAFDKDPMYVSKIIEENKIKEFCSKLGVTYKENKNRCQGRGSGLVSCINQ